jgi:hypothetical protein
MVRRTWKIGLTLGIGLLALVALMVAFVAASVDDQCLTEEEARQMQQEMQQETKASVPDIESCT